MENRERITMVCEDSFDGILTAVYEAFQQKGRQVNIIVDGEYNFDLFTEYIQVATDYEKSRKVAHTIYSKISSLAYDIIYHVAISAEKDKCSIILGMVIAGLQHGAKIVQELTNPLVQRCSDIAKKVYNEAHFYLEILRFEELAEGILMATIAPTANVMVSTMEHFSDRFPEENFFIYDENRRLCGIHEKNSPYFIRENICIEELLDAWRRDHKTELARLEQDQYADLWKVFFASIAIKERENYVLQRGNLPLHYRKHMTEFQDKDRR